MYSEGEWVAGDTLDTDGLNNEDYKSKYQQQLKLGRECMKDYHVVQVLTKNLLDINAEKERDTQYFRQQMEEKEKEEAATKLEVQRYVQEKERQNTESKYVNYNQPSFSQVFFKFVYMHALIDMLWCALKLTECKHLTVFS